MKGEKNTNAILFSDLSTSFTLQKSYQDVTDHIIKIKENFFLKKEEKVYSKWRLIYGVLCVT